MECFTTTYGFGPFDTGNRRVYMNLLVDKQKDMEDEDSTDEW
jgi:hypothetical protein